VSVVKAGQFLSAPRLCVSSVADFRPKFQAGFNFSQNLVKNPQFKTMQEVKDSKQATVRIGYDGRVHKTFRGPLARRRFENELAVLKYLEKQNCGFVPRVLESDASKLYMVTTNCGTIVDKISQEKLDHLFQELEQFGVRHDDPFARNVTYNADLGRFCLIDFEFASIIETGEGFSLEELEALNKDQKNLKALQELKELEEANDSRKGEAK
jgi:hypothetical protein